MLARLDPVRGTRPPAALIRGAAVAALLALAAGVLYIDPGNAAQPDAHAAPVEAPPGLPPPEAAAAPPEAPHAPPDSRLPVPSGLVGVPVRLADPAALAVLRPGDRVDLVMLPGTGAPAVLAGAALVLDAATDTDTPVLYVALTEAQSRAVLALRADARLSVIVRSR